MGVRRTLGIGCLAVGGVLVAAVGGGLIYLQTDSGERKVEALAEKTVRGMLEEGGFHIGEFDLKGDRLRLMNVTVDGSEHPDLLQIPLIEADLGIRDLVDKRIRLESLVIHQPHLDLRERADGTLDFPILAPSTPPPDPDAPVTFMPAGFTFVIDGARIEGGTVTVPSIPVTLQSLDLSTDLTVTTDDLQVSGLDASWQLDDPAVGASSLAGDLTFINADLAELSLKARTAGVDVQLEGAIPGAMGPDLVLDLSMWAQSDGPSLQRLAGLADTELPSGVEDLDRLLAGADLGGPLSALQFAIRTSNTALDDPLAVVSGVADLGPPWSATVTANAPQLGRLGFLGLPTTRGRLDAPFRVRSTTEGTILVEGTAVASRIGTPELSLGRASVDFDGQVSPTPILTATADYRALELGGRSGLLLDGQLTGSVDARRARGTLSTRDRRRDGVALDLSARFDLQSGDLRIPTAQLALSPDASLAATSPITARFEDAGLSDLDATLVARGEEDLGTLAMEASRVSASRTDARLRATALDLGPLSRLGLAIAGAEPVPIVGELNGTTAIRMASDTAPEVSADVTLTEFAYAAGAPFQLTLDADIAGDQLEIHLDVVDDDTLATLDARLPLEPAGFVPVCATGMQLRLVVPPTEVDTVRRLAPALADPGLPIDFDVTLEATGNACDPTLEVLAEARTVYDGSPVRAELNASDRPDHTLVAHLDAQLGDARLAFADLSASHVAPQEWLELDDPTSGLRQWDARIELDRALASRFLPDAGGAFEGFVAAAGDGMTPRETTGDLHWADPSLSGTELQRVLLEWSTTDETVVADLALEVRDEAGLHGHVEVGLPDLLSDPLTAPIQGQIDRSVIPFPVLAALSMGQLTDAQGDLALEGDVSGTLGAPVIHGSLDVEDGALTLVQTGIRYDQMQVHIKMDDRLARIRQFELNSRPRWGRFAREDPAVDLAATGTIQFTTDGGIAPDIDVQLDELWLMATNRAVAAIDASIAVGGTATAPRVSGDIEVVEGRFDIERYLFIPAASRQLNGDIAFTGDTPEVFAPDETPPNPWMDNAVVDLDLNIRRSVDLQATVPLASDAGALGSIGDATIDADISGEVELKLDNGQPSVVGRIEAEGDARLLTASFDVQRGTLDFTGGDGTHPNVDFLLASDGSGGEVTARVRGTPTQLEITNLTSDSGLSQADIMATLLFGRPLSDLGDGEGSSGAAVVQQALLSVAGKGVEDAIGIQLVDSVRYDAGDGLSLGWAVGSDRFLTVRLNPTADEDENTTTIQLSWFLGRMTELELQTGDRATSAVWLNVEKRF